MKRGVDLVVLHPRFGGEKGIRPAYRHAVGRKGEIVGNDDLDAFGVDGDRRRAFHRVGYALEAHPQARKAAHRPSVQPEVDDLLDRRGIEHRHHRRGKLVIGLVRNGRRLRRMIVAREHQDAAMLGRSGKIGVLEHIAATIDSGPLAVPHREHAVVFATGVQIDLLAAPDRRRGEVFVQTGLTGIFPRSIARDRGRPAASRGSRKQILPY